MAFPCYFLFFIGILFSSNQSELCMSGQTSVINYNLLKPDKIYFPPPILTEISGLTEIDASSVACIQDENGILFIYDLLKEEIKRVNYFSINGDYEGIARADKKIFILRSDGVLFEVPDYEVANTKSLHYSTGIKAKESEGLCFDPKGNRLLIAPKNYVGKKSENKNKRVIYTFDLKSKKVIDSPAFIFDLSDLKKFAYENKIKVPMDKDKKKDKNKPIIEFRPSAIGIHPLTNQLFVVSGMERLLFVFDMNGKIIFMERLDSDLFSQPEGITFLKNGDMLISNEGNKTRPTILRFNYHKN